LTNDRAAFPLDLTSPTLIRHTLTLAGRHVIQAKKTKKYKLLSTHAEQIADIL